MSIKSKQLLWFFAFFLVFELNIYLSNDMIMPAMLGIVGEFQAEEKFVPLSLSLYLLGGSSLLAHRSQHIAAGNFWRPTVGRHGSRMPAIGDAAPSGDEAQAGLLSHAPLKLVPGERLGDEAKNRMAKLLFATSYLEYCAFGNKLNLQFVELQRRQNIDPYLEHIHGLHDEDGRFIGFFTAATMAEFQACGAVSYYRDDMKALDDAYDAFVLTPARADDCFVSSLAIDEKYRGQGWFRQMFHEIGDLASRKGCARITLTVWEKSEALQVYLHKGFRSVGTFDYAYSLFYDRLHFLVHEGN